MAASLTIKKSDTLGLTIFIWVMVLLVSNLPDAIWQAVLGEPPSWLFWMKTGLLLTIILISLAWKPIQAVRNYLILLLVLMLALWGMTWVLNRAAYLQWQQRVNWVIAMAGFQLIKLAIALIMVGVLLVMKRKRRDFYLVSGKLKAPIKPSPDSDKPKRRALSWGGLGLILGVCIAPLTLLFFGIGNLPSSSILLKALPYFPAAILFAATNAFAEEMQFRASLLGDLQKAVGPDQAIWLTATFFGLAHYFSGPPSGIPGVLITGLLGALFAKCMLGSKGFLVPWFIHFCQNVVVYAFMAIGSVA